MKKSVSCNKFPSLHLIKSIIFYLLAVDQLPLRPPLKSPKFVFSSQNHAILSNVFFQRNVISQLLSQTCCITSLYYHKKHLINNFGFLICRRGFTCWWLFRWGWSFILSPTWFIYMSSPSRPHPLSKKSANLFFLIIIILVF